MSLTGALSAAVSGLTANSRSAALVASNIANATTESYGRRSLSLSSALYGTAGGVRINGVVRNVNDAVISDRRLSDSQMGFASDMQTFASRIEELLGSSDEVGSLTGRYSVFENALLAAASNPSSTQQLQAVAVAADDFANTLNLLSDNLQSERNAADRSIGQQVETLNDALVQIADLNASIASGSAGGADVSSLLDERQRVIDSISGIVPLRTVQRDNGAIGLYTASGTMLVDPSIHSEPVTIGFTSGEPVTASKTIDNGLLSGLTINGVAVNSTNGGPLGGGTLGAQLQIRDVVAVDMQASLDGIARDLIDRFSAGGPDATIAATDPGLFTDAGALFDSADEVGIAGRISLNALVSPDGTGAWRLRDGLGATTQGDVGDASLLVAYTDALEALTVPGSASLGTGTSSFSQHIADYHSAIAGARVRADGELSFAGAQNTALREMEYASGVDTDAELQQLMLIEQNYAANAQVISVVDELMRTLLNI